MDPNDMFEFWEQYNANKEAAIRDSLPPIDMTPPSESLLPREMPQSEGEHDEGEPDNPQQESTEKTRLKVSGTGPAPSFKRRVLGRARRVVRKISRLFRRRTPNEERG